METEAAVCTVHQKEYCKPLTFLINILISNIFVSIRLQLFLHPLLYRFDKFCDVCVNGMRSLYQVNIQSVVCSVRKFWIVSMSDDGLV